MSSREIMYRDALREALDHEMRVNQAVFIIGEGIAERGGSYESLKAFEQIRSRPGS